jgi:histidinol-phosphatase (PHP family)
MRRMIRLDYHLHSCHSVDGEATVREMCEAALARGLTDVCFTEHVDFDRADPGYGYLDWPALRGAIAEAQARYAGRLTVRAGIEFDFRRAYGAEPGEVLAAMDFDYAIGSVHTAGGMPIFRLRNEPPAALDARALQADYFAEVEALVASGWCHALGHFDYLFKQLPEVFRRHRDGWYWRRVERILAACIAGGVALEVNTHHLLDRGLGLAADVEVLHRYRGLGGRRVTVGSDAHRPNEVAHAFAEAEAALREAAFDTLTAFAAGRPYDIPLV